MTDKTDKTNPEQWSLGFFSGYRKSFVFDVTLEDPAFAAGHAAGDALRLKHQEEFEQTLFEGCGVRSQAKGGA